MKKPIIAILLTLASLTLNAADIWHISNYYVRFAYALGGAMPLDMPASIRSLNKFPLQANYIVGVDAYHPVNDKWGMMVGLQLEKKGMESDATVKGYSMSITQGSNTVSGVFTGYVNTQESQTLVTIPLQVTYDIGDKWRLKFGPYVSYLIKGKFEGYAYNGYLRNGGPTGTKVLLGDTEDSRGNYDFAEDMRKIQWGLTLGADWYAGSHVGAFAGLKFGMNGVFVSDFDVIEQTMHAIYGEIGILYRLK